MTKTKALKALYKKLAGVSTKEYTDTKIIEEITKVVEGSGVVPEAPEDGKVYGRKDGDWAEVTGDGGTFIVTISETEIEYEYTADKTFDEIYAAYESGQRVIAKAKSSPDSPWAYDIPLAMLKSAGSTSETHFNFAQVNDVSYDYDTWELDGFSIVNVNIHANNEVDYAETSVDFTKYAKKES